MVLLSIPNTPNDITPQWLTEALRSTDTSLNVAVTSLCIKPIAELTCAGQLARLHLSFSQPQSTLPSRLVVKLHAPDEPMRAKRARSRQISTKSCFTSNLPAKYLFVFLSVIIVR